MTNNKKNGSESALKKLEKKGYTFSMLERAEMRSKGKLSEEYLAACEEFDEQRSAEHTIINAIERWRLEPETTGRRKKKWKSLPMTMVDKEKVRRLFHKYIVTLEFQAGRIVAVVQAKDNVLPPPPLEEDERKIHIEWIHRRIAEAKARVAKKEVNS
jgi:hypothetical protein